MDKSPLYPYRLLKDETILFQKCLLGLLILISIHES